MSSEVISPFTVDLLYREHHGWLQRWLARRLGNPAQADDLAQDTFIRVLGHEQDLVQLREPRAYLATIARRLVINLRERQTLEQAYLEALANMGEALALSPEERCLLLETLCQIDAMLSELPAAVRRAFLLSQVEGLEYGAIAGMLGVSVRTVQRYVLRGLEQCILAAP
ncbi:sigma-70 family RNA polymerase sigma factor [Pigmentiphaga sp. H8]|uniref:sigma-70 family RNA polymerase sigma factor n=1 Tax=Pigmentiphaga sp. H8 TaxID=2488560 RepID=UPI000F594683|nr:sigma-70 family RNA polymerase sigma factor [Pigmentiphaga sp. H8]AZG11245.1 sigma-70 family RNA polymerase sigma factor [Pigmentiphaga sp. H8]